MKEEELRELATCAACHEKLGSKKLPLFYKVTVSRYGLDAAALKRRIGLDMVMNGNSAIAAAMGPDEDLATQLMEPRTFSVCEECSHERTYLMGLFLDEIEDFDRGVKK